MCTLSVVTRADGYLIGMNRDEKITRGAGFSPCIHEVGNVQAIYPSDDAGGSWIGVNDHGGALALLNWNDAFAPCLFESDNYESRGRLIPALLACESTGKVRARLNALDLQRTVPFRLLGVFPLERHIQEWRWDSQQLRALAHEWKAGNWFSSGLSDQEAESLRGAACREAANEPDAGSLAWLRRLHASHVGGPGPFSMCVHRPDAKTLSYSEIECASAVVIMRHTIGSPCAMGRFEEKRIARTRQPALVGTD